MNDALISPRSSTDVIPQIEYQVPSTGEGSVLDEILRSPRETETVNSGEVGGFQD
jgi:hypothetical protein